MVRILANGDIVPDDAARVQSNNRSSRSSTGSNFATGRFNDDEIEQRHRAGNTGPAGGAAAPNVGRQQEIGLVEAANRQLKQYGVPTITLGQYSIEPVFALAIMIALLFFGFPGLIIVGFMFLVHQLSKPDSQLGAKIGRTLGLYDSSRAVRAAPQGAAAAARNQTDRSHPKNSSVTETKRQQNQQQQAPGASGQPQGSKPFSGAGVRLGN